MSLIYDTAIPLEQLCIAINIQPIHIPPGYLPPEFLNNINLNYSILERDLHDRNWDVINKVFRRIQEDVVLCSINNTFYYQYHSFMRFPYDRNMIIDIGAYTPETVLKVGR